MAGTKSRWRDVRACHVAPKAAWASCLRAGAAAAGLVLAASHCGSSSNSPSFGGFAQASSSGGGGNGGGLNTNLSGGAEDGGAAAGPSALPPEMKTESLYQSPVATGNVVWIANPTSGLVAYIDAQTFNVQTVEAGDGPTYLAAVPDPTDDVAIVLNVLSQDATLLRDHMGTLSARRFPSTPDANSIGVSSSGRWAIAWTNSIAITTADPTQGFQDIAVLDLSGARPPKSLSVGYRPSKLAYSKDESHAFVVTQDGISVVDLLGGTTPSVTQLFPLSAPVAQGQVGAEPVEASTFDASAKDGAPGDAALPDSAPAEDAGVASFEDGGFVGSTTTPDVSFTPDGAYAFVRVDGVAAITAVSLATGTATAIPLPSPPSDLTMSPDGTFALAVLRDNYAVATLPIPGIVKDPSSFTTITIAGEIVGRAIITSKSQSALLFTTVASIDRLTVLTLQPTPTYRTVVLHAPLADVFPTDDALNAIVLHSVTPTAGSNVLGAFSIVPIAADLPAKIVGLPAPPTAVALAPAGDHAVVSIRDDSTGTYGLYLGLMPSLQVVSYKLASPPIAVGIVGGASRGYVAQQYAEGRITFVDLGTEDCDASSPCEVARTITGFDLSSRVVTGGSSP